MELGGFLSFEGFTLGAVIASLLGAPILYFLKYAAQRALSVMRLKRVISLLQRMGYSFPARHIGNFLSVLIVGFVIWWISHRFKLNSISEDFLSFFLPFALLSLLIISVWRDWQFRKIGIMKPEKSVSSGTDYESSLRLCNKSIKFLGTGAYKLTNNKEFELAVERCMRNGGSVQILISRPDAPPLTQAEKMADVDPGEYGTKVRSTLKKLRALKRDREFPIEVRFHNRNNANRMQDFRMMFVDDELLFLSYNLYGHGDGSDIPQLVLKIGQPPNRLRSFFYPYSESFDRVWRNGKIWDFREHLED